MESSSKIYTIEDFFENKNKIYKHCLVLNREDVEKADYLFGETAIRLYDILNKNNKFESSQRFIFFCGKVASNINKQLRRYNNKTLYLEEIYNNKVNDDDEDEDYVPFEIPVEQHFFNSFESNPDIYYAIKNLSYLEKKIIQHLYNGYTTEEVAYRFKINILTINNLLKRFDGLKFNKLNRHSTRKKIEVECKIIEESDFKNQQQLLELIDNKKHKDIYRRYLNSNSLESIAKAYGTTRSAVGVTIKRINDKLKKEGFYVNKRGQGGGRKNKRKA